MSKSETSKATARPWRDTIRAIKDQDWGTYSQWMEDDWRKAGLVSEQPMRHAYHQGWGDALRAAEQSERVNGWDALVAERDRLAEEVAVLKRQLHNACLTIVDLHDAEQEERRSIALDHADTIAYAMRTCGEARP